MADASADSHGNEGHCSWCLNKMSPERVTDAYHKYKCTVCGKGLDPCTVCDNYARWDTETVPDKNGKMKKRARYHWYCAQHRGEVPDFDAINKVLSDPSEYLEIYEKQHHNYAKASKMLFFGLGGALITGPIFYVAAPAIGGAIGSMTGLSGIAATNHGLALLGGGSLASGGFGMAGGTVVLTGVGGLAGGAASGAIAAAYYGEVKGFRISKERDGKYPAVVTINGFLSEQNQDTSDWGRLLPVGLSDHAWFHVHWEAKRLAHLGKMTCSSAGMHGFKKSVTVGARTASKAAAKKLTAATIPFDVIGLIKNPWHVAMAKAGKTGIMLADVLSRCEGKSFILMGHSLGARVIFACLTYLHGRPVVIEEAHLLGGAVGNNSEPWRLARESVGGVVGNYHSQNDMVLKYLYSAGTGFTSNPIGRFAIAGVDGIENIDVSEQVSGHMQYKTPKMGHCLKTAYFRGR